MAEKKVCIFKLGSSLILFLQLQAADTYATTGLMVLPGVPHKMVLPDFGRSLKPISIRKRGQIRPIKLLMPPYRPSYGPGLLQLLLIWCIWSKMRTWKQCNFLRKLYTFLRSGPLQRRHFLLVEKNPSNREAIKDIQRLSSLSVDPSIHLGRWRCLHSYLSLVSSLLFFFGCHQLWAVS